MTVFTLENINPDPKGSNLFIYGPGGDLINQGNARVSLSDPRQMSIAVKPAGNGVYIVRWITVSSEDGDAAQGAFVFTVNPSISAAPTAPLPTTMGAGSTPTWALLLVGAPALLVGIGSGWVLGRLRSGSTLSGRTIPSNHEEEVTKRKSIL